MEANETSVEKKASTGKKWLLIGGAAFGLICICLVIIGVIAVPSLLKMTGSGGGSYSGNADEQLKNDVLAAISDAEGCPTASIFSSQMMMRPEQSADGSWVEIWQVSACGASHMYSITFTPDGVGGTFFSATRMDE